MDLKKIQATSNEIISRQKHLSNYLDNGIDANYHNSKNSNHNQSNNTFAYIGYGMVCVLLATIASVAMAVDLDKFGKGVTSPMVKFTSEYWVYGAGIGGIATALLSEGDGRIRIIRGGTVFLGSSAICMGILAAMT